MDGLSNDASSMAGRKTGKRSSKSRKNWIECLMGLLRWPRAGKKPDSRIARCCHLHLGAHKTGTTYSQTVLQINTDKLRQAGVEYWDLQYTRKNLTPFLTGLSRRNNPLPPDACKERIDAVIHAPESSFAKRIIVSDENLTGFIKDIVRKRGYHRLGKRLIPVRDVLGGNVKVFFTIRSYADFISSMYCELVTTKPFFSFEEIRAGGFVAKLSWVSVYKELCKVFGKNNVVVFEYGSFFAQPADFLACLAGAEIDFKFPKKEIRMSPSARAIEFIGAEGTAHPELPVRMIVERANKRFPRNSDNPPFDPWTPEERALLDERYRKDVAEIPCWCPGE